MEKKVVSTKKKVDSKKTEKKVTVKKKGTATSKTATAKRSSKKRIKAFTLIELLAVIIILGILMIIAIPSVTTYISDSRKNAYIDTAKNIVSGARNIANEGKLGMYDTGTTYYLPASCINTENGLKSPYGEFTEAYVGLIFDGRGYNYYWVSTDSSGQGIKEVTNVDQLDIDKIESNVENTEIRNIVNTTQIDGKSKILILNGDCRSWDDERLATAYVGIDGGSSTEIKRDVTCEAGKYLPQGSETCSDCPAGSYCTGGTYQLSNNSSDQGIDKCAIGSYTNNTNSSSCNTCYAGGTTSAEGATYCNRSCSNNQGVGRWATPAWNNNVVSNLCTISSCSTSPRGIYTLENNVCKATGTFYANWWNVSIGDNYDLANYRDITFTNYTVNINNFNTPESGGYKAYAFFKIEVVKNIVTNRYLCFGITSSMNISGARVGYYCLKAKAGEATYQENKRVLQSAFGNSSYCTDNGTKYECKNYTSWISNGKFQYYVTKDGEVYACYDEPKQGLEKPEYYITSTRFGRSSGGCLSGDTEVDVYDRKKKRRFRKKLRDVTPDDLILCWDFDKSEFTYVEPLWIKKVETLSHYYLLEFSDGSKLEVVGDHKVFDVDRNKFVNAGADNELKIGSHVYNSNGEIVELVSWKVIEEAMDSYNVITNYHMNMFANGILTSCVLSNIYEIKDMKYVDSSIERLTNKDLEGISEKYTKGLRLNEVPSNFRGSKEETIEYIKKYVQKLISKEK